MHELTPQERRLFATALEAPHEDERADALAELHGIGSDPIFDRAAACTRSTEPAQRALGVDVLAQIGVRSLNVGYDEARRA